MSRQVLAHGVEFVRRGNDPGIFDRAAAVEIVDVHRLRQCMVIKRLEDRIVVALVDVPDGEEIPLGIGFALLHLGRGRTIVDAVRARGLPGRLEIAVGRRDGAVGQADNHADETARAGDGSGGVDPLQAAAGIQLADQAADSGGAGYPGMAVGIAQRPTGNLPGQTTSIGARGRHAAERVDK